MYFYCYILLYIPIMYYYYSKGGVVCQFSPKRDFEVIDINSLIIQPIRTGLLLILLLYILFLYILLIIYTYI